MTAQRFWKANAHQQTFGPGAVSFYDPTEQTYSGWTVGADFTSARLYDAMRGYNLTASGAVAWDATPAGGALDFAAAATNCQVDTVTYAPPAQYTILALVRIGTVQAENILTWVQTTDANIYDHQIDLTAAGKIRWYAYPFGIMSSVTTVTAGQMVHVGVTYDGTTSSLYINGILEASQAAANGGYTGYSSPVIRLGYKAGAGSYASGTHKTMMFAVAPFAVGAGQILEFAQSPFALFEPRAGIRVPAGVSSLSAAIAGTIPVTGAITAINGASLAGRVRRRGRYRVWQDAPVELQPVVSLAENYSDAIAVERAVDAAIERLAKMRVNASAARRRALVETLSREIVAAVEAAAEADDEEALIALL